MPCRTSSTLPKPPDMALNTAGSRLSRLTVTRLQPGRAQRRGMLRQQYAIGGQGDILDAGKRAQITDQIGKSRPQQRFAAGDAQLDHAEVKEQPREPQNLIETQPLCWISESGTAHENARAACNRGSGSCSDR